MVAAPRTPGGKPDLIFHHELLACDLDDAPDFKWKDPSCTIPCPHSPPPPNLHVLSLLLCAPLRKYGLIGVGDGVAIYSICTLTSDLTGTPVGRFTKHTSPSGVYYRVDVELQMSLVDEVLKFELLFDGKSCGEVTAKFV